MANGLYTSFVNAYLTQGGTQVDFDSDDIRAILIDTDDYTVDLDTHDFLDDVAAGSRVAVSSSLTMSVTGRTVDCADFSFSSVTGDQSEALIFYRHDGGSDAARMLIAYIDTVSSGLPVTPSGGDINIVIDSGVNRLFTL